MLDRTASTTLLAPCQAQSGQSIAKTHYSDQRSAARAAAKVFVTGAILHPTMRMLAQAYRCSVALVAQEVVKLRAEYNGNPPTAIDTLWASMDQSERDEFARRHLGSVWLAIEHVTA